MDFKKNQSRLKDLFRNAKSPQEKYETIIAIGKKAPQFPQAEKIEANIVHGCQSIMYLSTRFDDDKVYFQAFSEALISQGLGAILCNLYSGLKASALVECPPIVLKEIGILTSISPTRAGGVKSLYTKMLSSCAHLIPQK